MSFSGTVKAELCRNPIQKDCCAAAEAYGILLYANTFSAAEIRIITASRELAKRLPKLFNRAFGLDFDSVAPGGNGTKHSFSITDREKIASIFRTYGYEAGKTPVLHVNLGVLEEDCCKAAFIRGAYLAGGSMTDPEKRAHMEIVTDHSHVAGETDALLLEMGFRAGHTMRAGKTVLYFKRSEVIEDLFTTIGAGRSAMELMGAKVEKDMRNAVNRRVNCDSANADKIVSAAQAQLEKIRSLERSCAFDELPSDLQQTALLRVANPEASLSDLAALADPPVSKSCMNHRLRKLMQYVPE